MDKENASTIEDDVFIYPGAKIIGKITIGKGSKIGANCVEFCDILPYSIVKMYAPSIIKKEKK